VAKLVFYGNRESGHSYKVALALALLGLEHEYRSIDLFTPRPDRPAEFRAASRFDEVPVLIDGDRPPLVQSNAILLYLARTSGRLGAPDSDRVAEWLFWESTRLGFSVPNLRFARRFQTDTPDEAVTWIQGRAEQDLGRLDREFEGGRPFLLGDAVTIADLSCCGYLFWLDQAELDVARWPQVGDWLDRIRALPGWGHPSALLK